MTGANYVCNIFKQFLLVVLWGSKEIIENELWYWFC